MPRSAALARLLGLSALLLCFPARAQVVINEIHYHPRSDLQEDEFVEIHNAGPSAVDLTGWVFDKGIDYTFLEGTRIAPGAYLVVARDAQKLRAKYGLSAEEVLGDYGGALSNGGEALELVDASGERADRVRWGDEFPWPTEADGGGSSLERVDPLRDGDTARNWLPSSLKSWVHVEKEAVATSNKLYFYLEGAGECLVDAVSIRESGSEAELFPEGDFEDGVAGWTMAGTHSKSAVTDSDAWSGTRSLHIVATGPGGAAETSITCTVEALVPGRSYVLSFRAKALSGSASLIDRVSGGGFLARTDLRLLEGTPGRENSARGTNLRPLVSEATLDPQLPAPGQTVRLFAAVEDEDLESVRAIYDLGSGPQEVPLRDDGLSPDAVKGDGVFSGEVPGAPKGSIVDYHVVATDSAGQRVDTPVRRYPVSTFDVASNLPVYHIFIRPADWDRLNADVYTEQYFPAVFVHDGVAYTDASLRFHGGRTRLFRKKSLKLSFPDEHPFDGRTKVDLNGAAMDDDYLTEALAYWFYDRAGIEAGRTRFVRVELNGAFWGLFTDVEVVDERYLERRGLDPHGALYKSVGIVGSLRQLDGISYNGQEYTYESQYEKKTREDEPYDDLKAFIRGVHSTPVSGREAFLRNNLEVDQYLDYLAVTNVICVWDAIQHNFYLYRDTEGSGRWRVIPWDLDHAWGEWEWSYYSGDTYPLFMGTRSQPFAGVWYTWNELWTALLDTPRFREQYVSRVKELLETRFAEGPLFRKIDEMRAEIEATALLDEAKWPDALEPQHTGPRRTLAQEIPLLKQNITRRRQYLAGVVKATLKEVPSPGPFRRGDANGDDSVDLADAVFLLFYLFRGGLGLGCADAADADDNGRLDISDAIRILTYLYGNGQAPPAPGPVGCGPDGAGPGSEALGCELSTCGGG